MYPSVSSAWATTTCEARGAHVPCERKERKKARGKKKTTRIRTGAQIVLALVPSQMPISRSTSSGSVSSPATRAPAIVKPTSKILPCTYSFSSSVGDSNVIRPGGLVVLKAAHSVFTLDDFFLSDDVAVTAGQRGREGGDDGQNRTILV